MAGELKRFFDAALVRRLAATIAAVHPRFATEAFVARAARGLGKLELMDRGRHIMRALAAHLPPAYPDAIAIVLRSLGPRRAAAADDESLGQGMGPFFYLPHTMFVAEYGLPHVDLSLRAQHALTPHFTCEFSIRPFLAQHPEATVAALRTWATDADWHVRRLVSEGTRLRLPWGMRVPWLDAHPARVVELLDILVDDPSTSVRRSVANNVNDLGKVHPALMIETCARWLASASPERTALVEHALRGAIKRSDPRALALVGYGAAAKVAVDAVAITPREVAIGGSVAITITLRNALKTKAQAALVDLAVHFVKANGRASPKVFKLDRVALAPAGTATLRKTISLAVHTTRKPYRGTHAIDVVVNGRATRAGAFDVI